MKLRPFPTKVNIASVLEYGLMLLVLLYGSMWSQFTTAQSNTFLRLAVPVLAVLILLRMQVVYGARRQRLILLFVFLMAFMVLTRYNVIRYVLYYVLPLLLLTLYIGLADDRGESLGLVYKLSDIVVVLSVVSLICFVFGTWLHILPGAREATYYWANETRTCTTYYHLYYESQNVEFLGHSFIRNCGLFTEAPGFAIFLVYAIAAEVLLREHVRPVRCTILCAAIITTFSTKAILLAVIVFGLKYLISRGKTLSARRFKLCLIPAVLIVVGLVTVVLMYDKMQSDSFAIRMDDLQASWHAFLTNPLCGTGYYNDDSIIQFFRLATRPNNGLSMGVVIIMAQGGALLLALYVLPTIACIRRFHGMDRRRMAAFFLAYFGLMFISNMPYSFLAMFLLALSFELNRKTGPLPAAQPERIPPAREQEEPYADRKY